MSRNYRAIIQAYQAQRNAGQLPSFAFTAAHHIEWQSAHTATSRINGQLLRPLLSEAEMSAIAGRPVVRVNTDNLPYSDLGGNDQLTADQAEERSEAIIEYLGRRGIYLDHQPPFFVAHDNVSSFCMAMNQPSRPSSLLNRLAQARLPEPLRFAASPQKAGWNVILLPPQNWPTPHVWLDYLGLPAKIAERIPVSPDLRLLLQFHELGHARQKQIIDNSSNATHVLEVDADKFAHAFYRHLGGHEGIVQASIASWCLGNTLDFGRMRHTHLTAAELCVGKGPHPFKTPEISRSIFRYVSRRSKRDLPRLEEHFGDTYPRQALRLLRLGQIWNSQTKLSDPQLFVTGLTLEAAQLYMPKLMSANLPA